MNEWKVLNLDVNKNPLFTLLTSPELSASSAPIIFPVNNKDAAVDGPTKLGRKWVAAIPENWNNHDRQICKIVNNIIMFLELLAN